MFPTTAGPEWMPMRAKTALPNRRSNSGLSSASRFWQRERGPAGPEGVVRLVERRVPEGDDGVPFVLVQRPARRQDDVGHLRKVGVEELDQLLGGELLRDGRESGHVGEEGRDLPLFASQVEEGGILEDPLDDVRAQVVAEDALDEAALAPFDAVVEERGADGAEERGEDRDDERQPGPRGEGERGGRGREGRRRARRGRRSSRSRSRTR